jgi:2,7-dihydroxy-5-methyl-1-naphthoate 7-O-methyltransferase
MTDLFTPMAPRVAATLRLADHVAEGAGPVSALAERTGADPDALGRLVDHLVAVGIFERGDALSLTGWEEELRDDQAWLDIEGAIGRADLAALHLRDTVRTGQPAYPLTYARGFWEDLAVIELRSIP